MRERKGALMRGEPRKEDLINIPNVLCYIRILLVPVFVILFLKEMYWQSGIVIMIATATDVVDGWIARHFNMITDWGKFIDPLADKLLIATALICFVEENEIAGYMAVLIIAREFIVTGLRTVAMSKGVVIAASMTGKIKTVIQIIAVICVFLFGNEPVYGNLNITIFGNSLTPGYIAMFIATIYTIYSGIEYLAKNKELLADQ